MSMSYCLIGEDSLLIQCAKVLLENKSKIDAIVSPVASIQQWASDNDIFSVSSVSSLFGDKPREFDYIFSIVNSQILPDNILQSARKFVINYHDSKLPQYAGLNATNWAIINGEKEHGISWHVACDRIDAGDIVKQKVFSVKPDDTAFSLNLRCYENAVEAFKEMIASIQDNSLSCTPQNLDKRSYYAATKPIPNNGFIDWCTFSAELIDRMHRALVVEHSNNNLGSLKLYLGKSYVIIDKVRVLNNVNNNSFVPGTVLDIKKEKIHVATTTKVVEISKVKDKNGDYLPIEKLVRLNKIFVGLKLPDIGNTDNALISKYYPTALKGERFWVERLKKISSHNVFGRESFGTDAALVNLESDIDLKNCSTIFIFLYHLYIFIFFHFKINNLCV